MKRRSDSGRSKQHLRNKIIGLGEKSFKKSYYPQLQEQVHLLQESERKYRSYIDNAPHGVYILDTKGRFVEVNPAMTAMCGRTEEELIGAVISDILAPESLDDTVQCLRDLADGKPCSRVITVVHANGERRYWDIDGITLNRDRILCFAKDRTDLTRYEEELKLLTSAVKQSIDGLYIVNLDFDLVYCNDAFARMHGYEKEEIVGVKGVSLVDEKLRDWYTMLKSTLLEKGVWSGEIMRRRRDGSLFPGFVSATLVRADDGEPSAFLAVIRDITEQKKLEAQFHRAQRLESIGTLAGGVAHDFNNLLTGIQGNTSLMLMDIDRNHPLYERLTFIERHVKDGAALTRRLLGFVQGGKYEVTPADMNEVINDNSDMFIRTRKDIVMTRNLREGVWTTEVDRGQIAQVLLNLFLNASQAMPNGGEIYVETDNVVLDEAYTRPYGRESGRYVKVSVTDTGEGMDDKTMEHIFDPFFSTKERGLGSGLGLASSYGIIQNHQGIINVYSEKGIGSTFNIYLPATGVVLKKSGERSDTLMRGTETILLVDDEQPVLKIGSEMMSKLGYTVIAVQDGTQALDIYRTRGESIDLVVLDMIMPGMGGDEVFDALQNIDPSVRVLLASGYSVNGRAQRVLEKGCRGFIQKPFTLSAVSRKLRTILDN